MREFRYLFLLLSRIIYPLLKFRAAQTVEISLVSRVAVQIIHMYGSETSPGERSKGVARNDILARLFHLIERR